MTKSEEIKTELKNGVNSLDPINKLKPLPLIIIALIAAAGFIVVGYHVAAYGELSWDDPVREYFYSLRNPGLTTLMQLVTYAGQWPTIVGVCLLLLIYPETRFTYGIPASAAALLSEIIKSIVKPLMARPRPDVVYHLIEQGGLSFPSGHSIATMGMYGMIFILVLIYMKKGPKKNAILALCGVLAFAVGITRVYLGVHYPSDVVAGWCGGVFAISVVLLIWPKVKPKIIAKKTDSHEPSV